MGEFRGAASFSAIQAAATAIEYFASKRLLKNHCPSTVEAW